jgi:hypothetical protein
VVGTIIGSCRFYEVSGGFYFSAEVCHIFFHIEPQLILLLEDADLDFCGV